MNSRVDTCVMERGSWSSPMARKLSLSCVDALKAGRRLAMIAEAIQFLISRRVMPRDSRAGTNRYDARSNMKRNTDKKMTTGVRRRALGRRAAMAALVVLLAVTALPVQTCSSTPIPLGPDFASLVRPPSPPTPWPEDALSDFVGSILPTSAAHAAELREEPTIPKAPGALRRFWDSIKDKPLVRRVRSIVTWVVAGVRFVWAIPKAVIRGDSDALIEALSGLLVSASSADTSVSRDVAPANQPAADGQPQSRGDSTIAP